MKAVTAPPIRSSVVGMIDCPRYKRQYGFPHPKGQDRGRDEKIVSRQLDS
jgi:hypothetical protein